MINDIINYLKDKKIVILGFGREGQATYKLIRKHLPNKEIYIRDKNENIKNNELISNDKFVIPFTNSSSVLFVELVVASNDVVVWVFLAASRFL